MEYNILDFSKWENETEFEKQFKKTARWVGFVLKVTEAKLHKLKHTAPKGCGAVAGESNSKVGYRITILILLTPKSFVNRQFCKQSES